MIPWSNDVEAFHTIRGSKELIRASLEKNPGKATTLQMASRMQGIWCLSSFNTDSWYNPSDLPGGGRGAIWYWASLKEQLSKTLEPKRSEAWDFKQEKKLCSNPTALFHRTTISREKQAQLVTWATKTPQNLNVSPVSPPARVPHPPVGPLCTTSSSWASTKPLQFRYDSTTRTCWTPNYFGLEIPQCVENHQYHRFPNEFSPFTMTWSFSPIVAPQRWVRFWKGLL